MKSPFAALKGGVASLILAANIVIFSTMMPAAAGQTSAAATRASSDGWC